MIKWVQSGVGGKTVYRNVPSRSRPENVVAVCKDRDDAKLVAAAPGMRDVLLAYEQWEADLITNNDWDGKDGLPTLTQQQYDRLMEIQAMRNAVLERAGRV